MKPSRTTDDRYMDVKSLSSYSGLSVRTLRDYLGDSEQSIPHFRMKRKVLVLKSEFDGWMENFRDTGQELDALAEELLSDL